MLSQEIRGELKVYNCGDIDPLECSLAVVMVFLLFNSHYTWHDCVYQFGFFFSFLVLAFRIEGCLCNYLLVGLSMECLLNELFREVGGRGKIHKAVMRRNLKHE